MPTAATTKAENIADVSTLPDIAARREKNRETLTEARKSGFTHCLRHMGVFHFFRSQAALTRKVKQYGGEDAVGPNGKLQAGLAEDGNRNNLHWFC